MRFKSTLYLYCMAKTIQAHPQPALRSVPDRFSIRLLSMGYEWIGDWWRAERCSPFWRLWMNDEAGPTITVGRVQRQMLPGRIYIVPAGLTFSHSTRREVRHVYVHFELTGLPSSSLQEAFQDAVLLPANVLVDSSLAALRETLDRSTGNYDFQSVCTAKAVIHCAWASMVRTVSKKRREELGEMAVANEAIRPAIDYVAHHLADPIDTAVLGAACHLSRSRLVAVFKHSTGKSPAQYVVGRRVTSAAALLAETDLSIDAIASDCGFANRHYLTRVFTRHFGIPPARYRQASWDRGN